MLLTDSKILNIKYDVINKFCHNKFTSVWATCCSVEGSTSFDVLDEETIVSIGACWDWSFVEVDITFWIVSVIAVRGCVITSRIVSKVVFDSVDVEELKSCSIDAST